MVPIDLTLAAENRLVSLSDVDSTRLHRRNAIHTLDFRLEESRHG